MEPRCRSAISNLTNISRYVDKCRERLEGDDAPEGYVDALDRMEDTVHELLFILAARVSSDNDD